MIPRALGWLSQGTQMRRKRSAAGPLKTTDGRPLLANASATNGAFRWAIGSSLWGWGLLWALAVGCGPGAAVGLDLLWRCRGSWAAVEMGLLWA